MICINFNDCKNNPCDLCAFCRDKFKALFVDAIVVTLDINSHAKILINARLGIINAILLVARIQKFLVL